MTGVGSGTVIRIGTIFVIDATTVTVTGVVTGQRNITVSMSTGVMHITSGIIVRSTLLPRRSSLVRRESSSGSTGKFSSHKQQKVTLSGWPFVVSTQSLKK